MWAAVIGSPISHSLSPVLHRAAWDGLGLDPRWEYRRLEVDAAGVGEVVASMGAECLGLSVTMPCKQAVIAHLDAVDPLARAVGAVNTVVPSANMRVGFNTDVHGIVAAVRDARERAGLPAPSSALVLGGRATASSAVAALTTLGASRLRVAARSFAGPGSVALAATRLGVSVDHVPWADVNAVRAAVAEADVVVSTLPAGVADDLARTLSVREDQTLLDVVYAPRRTGLVEAWCRGGGVVVDGLDMLVHQACQQVQLMTGREPDPQWMFDALPDGVERL